jgi:hypothetical protein
VYEIALSDADQTLKDAEIRWSFRANSVQ